MNVKILNLEGREVGTQEALTAWEGRTVSPTLLHQVAVALMTNRRAFRAHTKDRSERRGGGRKPWRQKGTGRARHASIRSPLWRKGGVTFGPRAERTYWKRAPRTMKQSAFVGVLIGKARDEELSIVERWPDVAGKTKSLAAFVQHLPTRGSALLLVAGSKDARVSMMRAGKNLPHVTVGNPETVDVADLLTHAGVVTTPEGLAVLERRMKQ